MPESEPHLMSRYELREESQPVLSPWFEDFLEELANRCRLYSLVTVDSVNGVPIFQQSMATEGSERTKYFLLVYDLLDYLTKTILKRVMRNIASSPTPPKSFLLQSAWKWQGYDTKSSDPSRYAVVYPTLNSDILPKSQSPRHRFKETTDSKIHRQNGSIKIWGWCSSFGRIRKGC